MLKMYVNDKEVPQEKVLPVLQTIFPEGIRLSVEKRGLVLIVADGSDSDA